MAKQKKEECECNESSHEHKHADSEMLELNVLDMQLRQLEQQAMLVEQQIAEYQGTLSNLDELKKAKKGQAIIFPFSRDIFVEGRIEGTDLLVNVGSKTIVRKSMDETKKLVEKQKSRLVSVNGEIRQEIEKIMAKISEIEKKLS